MKIHRQLKGAFRSMQARLRRGAAILRLTRTCWRAQQLVGREWYYVEGQRTRLKGPHALPLLCECYLYDAYGLKRVSPDFQGVIADIGANIGAFSVTARRRFPAARLFAFEPSASLFSLLQQNVEGLKIEAVRCAVSDAEGEAVLVPGRDATSGHLHKESENSLAQGERVPCVALESVVRQCGGMIDLLKLDCEGSEYEILESSAMSKVRRVVAEIHEGPGLHPEQARTALERHGFVIEKWDGGIMHARRRDGTAG
jgi:FkbM family methyltransferase